MPYPGRSDYLPDSAAPNLHLDHPTSDECIEIWTNTSKAWKDSLTLPIYLKESRYLTTVPLAKDNGMSIWILTDKDLPLNHRPILCSCETFRKRSITSDASGKVENVTIHGIASVFCAPRYRRRGYAARMMKELASVLHQWQSDEFRVIGTVLYSDIGKYYYADLGWQPNETNWHLQFKPVDVPWPSSAQRVLPDIIAELCRRDEVLMRKAIATPIEVERRRVTIIPDSDHMLWHIGKEDFTTHHLFGTTIQTKGAIAGYPGSQVWAIWTHRYYGRQDVEPTHNVLYILRLVVEGDDTANKITVPENGLAENASQYEQQADHLKAVLQAAQSEASEWKLDHIKLWEPSPLVQAILRNQSDIEHVYIEREEASIASGYWYNERGEADVAPLWINNEHYAWC